MQLHPTLARQISKFLGSVDAVPTELAGLFTVISETYTHFDEDRKLIERSLDLSSHELQEYISRLKATVDAVSDGLLVVDINGKITSFNKRFVSLWRIPQPILDSRSDDKALEFVLDQLKDPNSFLTKVQDLYSQPDSESTDVLEFKDGRVFERFSVPQKVGEKNIGRVWSFRDVTETRKNQKLVEEKMKELESLNSLMVGRELKMVELKEKIASLTRELEKKE